MDIRTYLQDHILLFDGSMGTYCHEKIPESIGTPCELLNLTVPEKIAKIHAAYIAAGARAIKTNTFSASRVTMGEDTCRRVIRAGWDLASAHASDAFVFADIGPITVTDERDLLTEYTFVVDCFLACGATLFLLETHSQATALAEVATYIKAKEPAAFVLVSFASLPDGFTRTGQSTERMLQTMGEVASIDAVGLNCAMGARHMARLFSTMPLPAKPLSAMPNAGYPTVLGNRTYYDGTPSYFARQIAEMAQAGVRILGGCCGTTPAHIAAAAAAMCKPHDMRPIPKTAARPRVNISSPFWEAVCDPNQRPFAVELDPPENTDLTKFMAGAEELLAAGASAITIADCPIGRPRMDASLLACKLYREFGVDVLPHMTCRDRNLNATKALLLGLCAEGVHQVLTVTGDPIPSADRDEVKSVYNFNSRMLAAYIAALSENSLPTPFYIFAALNVNAKNFDVQLRLAKEKEEAGVVAFLTQPILTEEAFQNVKRARATLRGRILGGIFPLVSYKNACFMNSEVAGVRVDEALLSLYENKTREEAEELAYTVSLRIARALSPYVDGYYLMTPFARTTLVGRIMTGIREEGSI